MSNLLVIVICLGLGLLLQHHRRLPDNFALSLNTYVIYIALPALIIHEVPHLHLDMRALLPVVFAWIIMVATAGFVVMLARYLHWSREVTGALVLTVSLGNTGFVGIPLIDALLGHEAIPYAILYDQFGTFIALNTAGSFVAAYYSGGATSWQKLVKTIVTFPPFIALIVAFITIFLHLPELLIEAIGRISATLVPVVMVAVGLQWRLRLTREIVAPLGFGLLTALVITPFFALLLLHLLGIAGLVAQVIVLQAAMPAMISAGVLAISYQLAPRLASSLVGYSLLLSLITVWAWRQII